MRRTIGAGISLWVLAAALPAQAQEKKGAEQQDSTITVTATRIPTDVKEVPATVTVIDERKMADELTERGYDNVVAIGIGGTWAE